MSDFEDETAGDLAVIQLLKEKLVGKRVQVVEGSMIHGSEAIVVQSLAPFLQFAIDKMDDIAVAVFDHKQRTSAEDDDGTVLNAYIKLKSSGLWVTSAVFSFAELDSDNTADEGDDDDETPEFLMEMPSEETIEAAALNVALSDGFPRLKTNEQRMTFARPIVNLNWKGDIGKGAILTSIVSHANSYLDMCILPLRIQMLSATGATNKEISKSLGISVSKTENLKDFPVPDFMKANVLAHPSWKQK
jgi:hypothetical protein